MSTVEFSVWIEENNDASLEAGKAQVECLITAYKVQEGVSIGDVELSLMFDDNKDFPDPPRNIKNPCVLIARAVVTGKESKNVRMNSGNLKWCK